MTSLNEELRWVQSYDLRKTMVDLFGEKFDQITHVSYDEDQEWINVMIKPITPVSHIIIKTIISGESNDINL